MTEITYEFLLLRNASECFAEKSVTEYVLKSNLKTTFKSFIFDKKGNSEVRSFASTYGGTSFFKIKKASPE